MICLNCKNEIDSNAAFCPYCGTKTPAAEAGGSLLYQGKTGVGLWKGDIFVYQDRIEFLPVSGQKETHMFSDCQCVKRAVGFLGAIILSKNDGSSVSFNLSNKVIDQLFPILDSIIKADVKNRPKMMPEETKTDIPSEPHTDLQPKTVDSTQTSVNKDEARYVFASNILFAFGKMYIFDDKMEFRANSGKTTAIKYNEIVSVRINMSCIEVGLTNGKIKSYTVPKDIIQEVHDFIENAIMPYLAERQAGFNLVFGIDEKIEINEERGVFRIIRKGGREVTEEYGIGDIIKYESAEVSAQGNVLGAASMGNMIAGRNGAVIGAMNAMNANGRVDHVGVVLSINTKAGIKVEKVKFGDFIFSQEKSSKKYDKYISEVSKFTAYMDMRCHKDRQDTASVSRTETLGIDVTEELRKFKGLLDDGIINEEEFQAKKKQLLGL